MGLTNAPIFELTILPQNTNKLPQLKFSPNNDRAENPTKLK